MQSLLLLYRFIRRHFGGLLNVLMAIVALFGMGSVHLAAFVFSLPESIRSLVDLNLAASFSLSFAMYFVLSIILSRIIILASFALMLVIRIQLNGVAFGLMLPMTFSVVLQGLLLGKSVSEISRDLKLDPVLIDTALKVSSVSSLFLRLRNAFFPQLILASIIFFGFYLGSFAPNALVGVFLVSIVLFLPFAAGRFYAILIGMSDLKRYNVFEELKGEADRNLAANMEMLLARSSLIVVFVSFILSLSAIAGHYRLERLKIGEPVIFQSGDILSKMVLVLSNNQTLIFWNNEDQRFLINSFGPGQYICEARPSKAGSDVPCM